MEVRRAILTLLLAVITCTKSQPASDDLLLISRSRTGRLDKYDGYIEAAVLHFNVPEDTSFVSFKFIADEISKNNIFNCYPKNVTIALAQGSPPVINPDDSKYPCNFILDQKPKLYWTYLKSNKISKYINVTTPYPGTYYLAAFNPYTDPRDDGIIQQGLSPDCSSMLDVTLYGITLPVSFIKEDIPQNVELNSQQIIYKFYIHNGIDHILLTLSKLTICPVCSEILVKISPYNIPVNSTYNITRNNTIPYHKQIWVLETTWYYLAFDIYTAENRTLITNTTFDFVIKYFSMISSLVQPRASTENEITSVINTTTVVEGKSTKFRGKIYRNSTNLSHMPYKEYQLVKASKSDSFLFTYDLAPNEVPEGSSTFAVNVTSGEFAVLKFEVVEAVDVGGTLQFIVGFKPIFKKMGKYRVLMEPDNHTLLVCIHNTVMQIPTWPNHCVDPVTVTMTSLPSVGSVAPIRLNHTVDTGSVQIPYPEAGTWYVTLKLYCNGAECVTRCDCPVACRRQYSACTVACESGDTCKKSEGSTCDECASKCARIVISEPKCGGCDCDGPCVRDRTDDDDPLTNNSTSCNSTVVFDVSSYPCVNGACGNNGKCVFMLSEGFVYSTCNCKNNYRGWDCSDDSFANSFAQILLELLLLVLSNLMFLPVVFFAYRRRYYVETFVYFATCFFSSFYHYCDAGENIVSVCIFRLSVLQFSDFYCGLLSIWVTLVAMAHLPPPWPPICHMVAAIVLGCGTTYDKTSIWMFILPAVAGIVIISASWAWKYVRNRSTFPNRKYLSIFLPVGLVIVALALLLYATLQTKNNYKYVHSAWHILMAIGVILLLPDDMTFVPTAIVTNT